MSETPVNNAFSMRSPARLRGENLGRILFAAMVIGLLMAGWAYRGSEFVTARHGLGYWCGIIGASMMALLLLYPLRKRLRSMRSWGRLPTWFRGHMAFGLLGPSLVIVHSNFEARSMNAWVALMAMLIVAGSGLVGRYLYVRIHRGLHGAKLEAKELLAEVAGPRAALRATLENPSECEMVLRAYETAALAPSRSFFGAIWRMLTLGRRERRAFRVLEANFETALSRKAAAENLSRSRCRSLRREERRRINGYLGAVRKAAGLAVYERLFALWHVLHLPLIALLVITAVIHIVAVQFY